MTRNLALQRPRVRPASSQSVRLAGMSPDFRTSQSVELDRKAGLVGQALYSESSRHMILSAFHRLLAPSSEHLRIMKAPRSLRNA